MPGKVKVKIISGRNLPVMDRSSDTTDAYVEVKLGTTTYKTDVCRKTLHPHWNSEWYRFEVDDSELQDEPLQVRIMDHDTYSANDAIGKVYVDLNPLLLPVSSLRDVAHDPSSNTSMSGWIPVYDTMHGIRGEVNIAIKVELFSDFNRFRQSSCGVQFFYSKSIPHGYSTIAVHGLVEELVVNDDPEYQWIDKIRTPRASNEARQTLFFKLSGELRRKIGVKAIDLGGNAVIGYCQCFDLEGESGIVARGIGTAVTLSKQADGPPGVWTEPDEDLIPPNRNVASPIPDCPHIETIDQEVQINSKMIQSPAKLNSVPCIYRRSSDSDLSITPKGNSLTGSGIALNGQMLKSTALMRSTVPQENYEMLEYPFITMTKYPPGCVLQIGGAVFARSVKLLERISNLEEPESRDIWWSEIRMEIRSHARSLNCNAILGYSESTSICEDVCVLSASGTAAVSNFHYSGDAGDILTEMTPGPKRKDTLVSPLERNEIDKDRIQKIDIKMKPLTESNENDSPTNGSSTSCSICHLPYNTNNIPVRTTVLKCSTCRVGKVPDVIIATIEVPENLSIVGRACFVQSFVCRQLKDLRGESNAKEISDGLPFLEYELHRLLVNKLKIKGMNAIFGLQIRISIGEKMLVASATGTAVFVPALPKPQLPKLVSDRNSDEKKLFDLQKHLNDTVKRNREIYHLGQTDDYNTTRIMTDEPEEEQPPTAIDLTVGNKDCCLLEVDDPEDADVLNIIMEERPPDGFHVVNTEFLPGLEDLDIVKNLQMFTQIYRARFLPPYNFDVHFRRLLQSVYFKLRRMVPCALCNLQCRIDLPETDEIQLCLLGIALALEDPQKIKGRKRNVPVKIEEDEMIFNLEEDQINENFSSTLQTQSFKNRQKLPLTRVQRLYNRERHGVDMTPLSYIPGAKVEQYLGNFNFFFIRETTSIREEGGLSGFVHSFLTEVLAIVRAHVTALGGNALIAYFMRECVLNHNLHKNQGQCLINVGGDVVFVTYNSDE